MLERATPVGVRRGGEDVSRPVGPMTAKIENFLRMEARGEDHDTVLREIFGEEYVTDPVKKNAAESKMHRWRHRDDAQAIWDDEIRSIVKQCIPSAVNRIKKQVDDDNGWLANKAANDVVNLAKTTSIFQSDEKAINVKIEGLPDIGSPDDDV
jgi:hypothetical protein